MIKWLDDNILEAADSLFQETERPLVKETARLGQRLLSVRRCLGVSRRKVAWALDISESTVVRLETWPGHVLHPHVASMVERFVEILEAKI
jgi:hypothetical protein